MDNILNRWLIIDCAPLGLGITVVFFHRAAPCASDFAPLGLGLSFALIHTAAPCAGEFTGSEYSTELFFILESLRYTYYTAITGCGVYHKKVAHADPDIQMDSIKLVDFKKAESTWGEPLL